MSTTGRSCSSETWSTGPSRQRPRGTASGGSCLRERDSSWSTTPRWEGVGDRSAVPFLERGGRHWGPPADSATAIAELERMRASGVCFLVFAWPAFWWLDHYADFRRHLCSRFPCALHRDDVGDIGLVAFALGARDPAAGRSAWPGRLRELVPIRRLVPERALGAAYRQAIAALASEGGVRQLGDYLEFGVYASTLAEGGRPWKESKPKSRTCSHPSADAQGMVLRNPRRRADRALVDPEGEHHHDRLRSLLLGAPGPSFLWAPDPGPGDHLLR